MRLAAITVLAFPALVNARRLPSGQLKLKVSVIEWGQQPELFTVYAGIFLFMLLVSGAIIATLVRAIAWRVLGKPGGFSIRRTDI